MKASNLYVGKWRITEMGQWDQDYVDMETEGYFYFGDDEIGDFQFGLIQGKEMER